MNRLEWRVIRRICFCERAIPAGDEVGQHPIRHDNWLKLLMKRVAWYPFYLRNELLTDGFIIRHVGRWVRHMTNPDTIFLDIGCGDMMLNKYLPRSIVYNAFDVSFSEFHLRRMLNKGNVNLAFASATCIPLNCCSVNLIAATEVLEHIDDVDSAIKEIYRVAKRGAILLISIPNNHCHKYQKKGPHPDHCNSWRYDEFVDFICSFGFRLVEGSMKGFWMPLPLKITKTSYQLPITSNKEFYNTNFFFVFECTKAST